LTKKEEKKRNLWGLRPSGIWCRIAGYWGYGLPSYVASYSTRSSSQPHHWKPQDTNMYLV